MDMAFLRRAERMFADERPVQLDHATLLAALAARRSASGEARVEARVAAAVVARGEQPLVELLLGGPRWRQALSAQQGCFSRAEAGRRLNGA